MNLCGKGVFLSNIFACKEGNADAAARFLCLSNISHIIIKIADGINLVGSEDSEIFESLSRYIESLRVRKISVWGWHNIFGELPLQEAQTSIMANNLFEFDGFVVKANVEFKSKQKRNDAKYYMNQFRKIYPDLPIALSTYRFPKIHKTFPWDIFLKECDVVMPQFFGQKSHGHLEQNLIRSLHEFREAYPLMPICPTGPLLKSWGYIPYAQEICDFIQKAKALNSIAVNFYRLDEIENSLIQNVWQKVVETPWLEEPEKIIPDKITEIINQRELSQISTLYQENALMMTDGKTLKGHDQIQNWYKGLFEMLDPDKQFTISNLSETKNTYTFTWLMAQESKVKQSVIENTITLSDGKISSHMAYFADE